MKLLKERIKKEGIIQSETILNVSMFLNMNVDAPLMKAMGETFADYFKDDDFDIYITVEASGIAPSVFASLASNKPLVVIKKTYKEAQLPMVQQPCYSYTKKQDYFLTVNKEFIEGKRCILIDDFLASGSVVENVDALCNKVGATLVKTGICISKDFQEGIQNLDKKGYEVHSLARIKSMDPNTQSIEFI